MKMNLIVILILRDRIELRKKVSNYWQHSALYHT